MLSTLISMIRTPDPLLSMMTTPDRFLIATMRPLRLRCTTTIITITGSFITLN